MANCPNIAKCPIFEKTKTGAIKSVFLSYCEKKYDKCARYQLKLEGKEVPVTLLPNGDHLATLAE